MSQKEVEKKLATGEIHRTGSWKGFAMKAIETISALSATPERWKLMFKAKRHCEGLYA
jgi:hypothetical protein